MARCKAAGILQTVPRIFFFQERNRRKMHPYESVCQYHSFSLPEHEHSSPVTWDAGSRLFALLPSLRHNLPCAVLKSSNTWQAVPALSLHRENRPFAKKRIKNWINIK